MAYLSSLSTRDLNILEKIQDPEFDPSQTVQVDSSLPKDPNVQNITEYESIAAEEKRIILAVQQAELQLAGLRPRTNTNPVDAYKECLAGLGTLLSSNPSYGSARNNRAQASRRLYGDGMLVAGVEPSDNPLIVGGDRDERLSAAGQALSDLETCISLLSPTSPHARLSPHAAKTLSLAHTQRAAIYHQTSKMLARGGELDVDPARREASWKRLDFEEAASMDFALGGRYGNEIAKGLAVSTNPTAKLCGQMVREAMKKEYGPAFGG
ncbi:hypothetical protein M406DRAFT_351324 [Cryphonectria parasitica EP155]|uniref:Tetratricopeptide repeat protein 36 n=1 Tax=Cryphonectria parasitica (strain ATCC 38755 / EP155) TaxID=660469 RepID=A0A9P4Y346_CRYP1|nr:uncharacterized protein M406DRAFT_351324 [Cryphonectria parasitica EP155]KAF3766102.1 hypothetical protein M406DRAFT_351324 [Cryphonectria parasitica EP155]